ncbi:hypothetical protein CKO32_16840 [Afifella marina DSM 2698]|nr:hypothetical protein [Afifella marina DSM 2698]MBK1628945.1 hypothetical protein [Afifella marina]MBK5918324.1 hypothetical protein [Afifella marina]RAI22917.1 hypothetical protein CH311_04100 [Afifella marina DSM 2698]
MLQVVDPQALEAGALLLVPRLDVEASAGAGRVAEIEEVTGFFAFDASYLREIGVNPHFARSIRVAGRSMLPTLGDQDWVIVDTSIDSVVDEALYAVNYGGLALVKRVRLRRDGSVVLCSDNKTEGYVDEIVPPAELPDLHIVGRVKGHFHVT